MLVLTTTLTCISAAPSARVVPMMPPSRGTPVATRTAVLRQAAASAASALATAALAVPLPVSSIPPEMLGNAPGGGERFAVLYTPPSVKGQSSPEQIALAQHLQKTGAKFYGAYWCRFCNMQRSVFGAGGVRELPYVECAEDGFNSQTGVCRSIREVDGYPTWQINGKFYSGMKTLQQLQALSGFDASVTFPEYVAPPPPPRPTPPPGGFKPPPVTAASTPLALALAEHLKASGATFYGAHWCGFCNKQRVLFGAEGTRLLPYVECDAEGYQANPALCGTNGIRSYPSWQINGRVYSGMRTLEDLAELSGLDVARAGLVAAADKKPPSPARPAPEVAPPPSLGIANIGGAPQVVADENCKLSDENCK